MQGSLRGQRVSKEGIDSRSFQSLTRILMKEVAVSQGVAKTDKGPYQGEEGLHQVINLDQDLRCHHQ